MVEDLTKTLLLKRSTKKKSGYSVAEEDSGYYLENAPSKARVNPGDRVVGINGIAADDFLDEDDANGLIESIRIVVVPKDKLDEYDEMYQGDDVVRDGEDEYDEYDRPHGVRSTPKNAPKSVKVNTCGHCGYDNHDLEPDEDGDLVCVECGHVIDPPSDDEEDVVYKCLHCDHMNVNLTPDDDGDLVCQECGHVMEPDVIHLCDRCDFENRNLERDEEGDLVCQQCGHVIPENTRESEDDQNADKIIYECPDCDHKNIDPQPDEEGDRVCEECGCILPEKEVFECEVCTHKTLEPKRNKDGDFLCEHCGSALDVDVS